MTSTLKASLGYTSVLSLGLAIACGSSSDGVSAEPDLNAVGKAGSAGKIAISAGGSNGKIGSSSGGTSYASGGSASVGGSVSGGSGGAATVGGGESGGVGASAGVGGSTPVAGNAGVAGSAGEGGGPSDARCWPKSVGGGVDRLASQRALALDTPLNRVQWLGAHNSWNDSSALWANQRWSALKLLESGIRSFDLDLHRNSSGHVRLCHDKCSAFYSAEDDYGAELATFASWLADNPCEILFIDLEDKVNHEADVVGPLREHFGGLLYAPSDKPNGKWETPREMIERGKRVIVKSANVVYPGGPVWDGKIFAINAPPGYNYQPVKDFGIDDCTAGGKSLSSENIYGVYDSKIGQGLPFGFDETGTIDAGNIPRLLSCGLTFIDVDRWDDGMLEAAVWSWASGEPNGGTTENCAEVMANGRWNDVSCDRSQRFVCQTGGDFFAFSHDKGPWSQGQAICSKEFPGSRFSAPQNALQNSLLAAKHPGEQVWLNFSDWKVEASWQR